MSLLFEHGFDERTQRHGILGFCRISAKLPFPAFRAFPAFLAYFTISRLFCSSRISRLFNEPDQPDKPEEPDQPEKRQFSTTSLPRDHKFI